MSFSISPVAAREARDRLERSSEERPVATLVDSSTEPLPISSELAVALSRKASDGEIVSLLERQYPEERFEMRLNVEAHPRKQFSFWSLFSLDGIELALPLKVRFSLRNCMLDYAEGRFVLKSRKNTFLTLTDALR